ncbi:sulfur carrier protein ThiS [Pseudodesulfovibrio cashew]|uniref:Sulfur carrier protein ThiS n=1 Tax=Pseudodesulfovibrio cashew TaxID=2678688 RepID=A0A6I6JD06_9BACT|nr:sulfur carrier protein ThiS [Pseudodesulfovibrio cashew]QGY40695.1 sulfur carrier protein ThiS [Pseudodesulfovibrio cashew]
MQIVLNGSETELADGITVLGLLESRDISAEAVVVELNREIVPADAFGETTLNDGDHLEVLRFVGGG